MKAASLLTLALCGGFASVAQAQTVSTDKASLSVYGLLDMGIGSETYSQNWNTQLPSSTNPFITEAASKSVTGLYSGGVSCSRVGIKGDYQIAEGWKAVVTLEAAINATSGNLANASGSMTQNSFGQLVTYDSALSGQLFSRACFAGVSSEAFGTLTFGRHQALMLDVIAGGYDPVQAAQLFSPIGFSGAYGGGGATDSSRVDQSLKYTIKSNGVNFGLIYKFGNMAGSSSAGSGYELNLGYEAGGFGIQAAYQKLNDAGLIYNADLTPLLPAGAGPGGAGTTGLGASNGTPGITVLWADTTASLLAARYKAGDFTFRLGYEHIQDADPSNPAMDNTATQYLGQTVGYNLTNLFTALGGPGNAKTLSLSFAGVSWDATSKFNASLGYYTVKQNNFSGQTTLSAGTDHFSGSANYTSLLLDYHFTKRFDVYLGMMANTVKDGMAYYPYPIPGSATGNQYLHDSNTMTGLGFRFAF